MVVPFRSKIVALFYDVLKLPALFAVTGFCLAVLVESTVITFFLRKLPIAQKLL